MKEERITKWQVDTNVPDVLIGSLSLSLGVRAVQSPEHHSSHWQHGCHSQAVGCTDWHGDLLTHCKGTLTIINIYSSNLWPKLLLVSKCYNSFRFPFIIVNVCATVMSYDCNLSVDDYTYIYCEKLLNGIFQLKKYIIVMLQYWITMTQTPFSRAILVR